MMLAIVAAAKAASANAPSELTHLGVGEDMIDRLEALLPIPIMRALGRGVHEAEADALSNTRELLDLLGGALLGGAFPTADRIKIAEDQQIAFIAARADLLDDLGEGVVDRLAARAAPLIGIGLGVEGDDVKIEPAFALHGRREARAEVAAAAIRVHRIDLPDGRDIESRAIIEKSDMLPIHPVRLTIIELKRPISACKSIKRADELGVRGADSLFILPDRRKKFLHREEIDLKEGD